MSLFGHSCFRRLAHFLSVSSICLKKNFQAFPLERFFQFSVILVFREKARQQRNTKFLEYDKWGLLWNEVLIKVIGNYINFNKWWEFKEGTAAKQIRNWVKRSWVQISAPSMIFRLGISFEIWSISSLDLCKWYQYLREINCLTELLRYVIEK